MKIVIFGASGGTGLRILEQAPAAGHVVTAFVRSPSKMGLQDANLILIQRDVMDAAAVEKAISRQEAVISLLGATRLPVQGMLETAAKNIVAAMKKEGRRLVSTTGPGGSCFCRECESDSGFLSGLDGCEFSEINGRGSLATIASGYVGRDSNARLSRAASADFAVKE